MSFDLTTCCAAAQRTARACYALGERMGALEQLLAGFIPERVTVIDGKRSDDDVARVDANEVRAAEKMKISVNEIDGKETVRKGGSRLCEALTQRSESDRKETVRRGGYHLDETLTYRFRGCEKEEFVVGVQLKKAFTVGVQTVKDEATIGSMEVLVPREGVPFKIESPPLDLLVGDGNCEKGTTKEGGGSVGKIYPPIIGGHALPLDQDEDDCDGLLFSRSWPLKRGEAIVLDNDAQAAWPRVPAKVRKRNRGRTRSWKFRKHPKTQRRRKRCGCFRRRPPRLGMDRTLETKVISLCAWAEYALELDAKLESYVVERISGIPLIPGKLSIEAFFILPKRIIKEIEKLCSDFLWGVGADGKKRATAAWQFLALPKKEGGVSVGGMAEGIQASEPRFLDLSIQNWFLDLVKAVEKICQQMSMVNETRAHLFGGCIVFKELFAGLLAKAFSRTPSDDWDAELQWASTHLKGEQLRSQVAKAV
ncbi:unnamed protein product [Linum tenue]|uniref:Uncharacterized protein n=1 Tax=Linum tenue TaxID=586396 RepID=A0AAV0ICQ8_9ROSI|nr:unnamed protein product [Linum tenue]